MKRTFLTLVSMAFICAMTLTGCTKDDNPTGGYPPVRIDEVNCPRFLFVG